MRILSLEVLTPSWLRIGARSSGKTSKSATHDPLLPFSYDFSQIDGLPAFPTRGMGRSSPRG
jgi:hypothetical protein